MRRTIVVSCLLLFALPFVSRALAQDEPKQAESAKAAEPQVRYYHLEFVVQELGKDGKPTNSRTYTTTVSTSPDQRYYTSIHTESKIPIITGAIVSGNASVNTEYQYQDVGVNIDVHRVLEVGRQLSFQLNATISSVAENPDASLHQPIIRENKWQANVLIPVGKPTIVFTSDTLDSKGSMQLLVTATAAQ